MAEQRGVGIAIPLTAEQKQKIRQVTGAECSELVFVAPAEKTASASNKLTSSADSELAQLVWQANQEFVEEAKSKADAMKGWDHAPALVFVR